MSNQLYMPLECFTFGWCGRAGTFHSLVTVSICQVQWDISKGADYNLQNIVMKGLNEFIASFVPTTEAVYIQKHRLGTVRINSRLIRNKYLTVLAWLKQTSQEVECSLNSLINTVSSLQRQDEELTDKLTH